MSTQRCVIVGAGQAGGTAALELRRLGFDGPIDLIGSEPHIPYERPPLSKSFLAGEPYRSHDLLPHAEWFAEHDVTTRLGRTAIDIDRQGQSVVLDDGARIDYDKLLIATGSRPRTLAVPGGDNPAVHYLRTLEDSTSLGSRLRSGSRVLIVGGGWIGLEVAATARLAGCRVTVVDPHDVPLQTALGVTVGGFFRDLHQAEGVDFVLGARVVAIDHEAAVPSIVLADGQTLTTDTVVVGIGADPRTTLGDPELLAGDGGISVDTRMRTDDPDVFAAGDIATVANPFYGVPLRSEHWANALMTGKIAARSMLGLESVFDPLPFFFTDQYDVFMEYAGWSDSGNAENVIIRGDLHECAFQAFWLNCDRVVAAMHVNRRDEGMTPLQELIRRRVRVDPRRLADPHVALADLLA